MKNAVFLLLILLYSAPGFCQNRHEYTVIHQQANWEPQEFSQNVFGARTTDFAPFENPELTELYEKTTMEEQEPIDDQCTLYKAKLTQTEFYFQYIRYKTEIPDLKEFTVCSWMRYENVSSDHTILSYATVKEPREIRSWLYNTDRSTYFNLAVGGSDGKGGGESVHLFSINYPFRRRRWYHSCMSWSGITGNWLLYVEGERVAAGNSPKTIGRVIRGGGVAVTGQTQGQPGGGFIEEGGFEGEITLVKLLPKAFSQPLKIADYEGNHLYRTSCDGLCKSAPPSRVLPTVSGSKLPAGARELLALPKDRPIRVAEVPQRKTSQSYFVREDGVNAANKPSVTYVPVFSNAVRRQVLFQNTPVPNGGVQLFYRGGPSRSTRSLDHFLFDLTPTALPLTDGSIYGSKDLFLTDSFTPNLDFVYHQGNLHPFQQQLKFGQFKVQREEPRHVGENREQGYLITRGAEGDNRMGSIKQPQVSTSTVSQVLGGGKPLEKGGARAMELLYRKPETMSVQQSAEKVVLLQGQSILDKEVRPIIDWRTTPKKLYAGAMWLRANPVCRKF